MKKLFLGILINVGIMIVCVGALSVEVLAATHTPYLDVDGNMQTITAATEITSATNTWTEGWYVVNSSTNITGNVIVSGDVHLILADGQTLNVSSYSSTGIAGINVTDGNSLTIYGQMGGTGELVVIGGHRGAAIGGGMREDNGTVIINGGRINATNRSEAAGIGGGWGGDGGNIIINRGNVVAVGELRSTGIGGGYSGNGGNITINGGTITAKGNSDNAGIGGGNDGVGGNITINGGTITATGGNEAAGIGSGSYADNGGNITIKGGTITASSEGYGAGIGGGLLSNGGTIIIEDGLVTATACDGAAIGGGAGRSGYDGIVGKSAGVISIKGGNIIARTTSSGAAIGNGLYGSGGDIIISGGTVFANAFDEGNQRMDIGNGYEGAGVALELSGKAALFLRNDKYVEPITDTHEHKVFSDSTEVTSYIVSLEWDSEFGAWLPKQLDETTLVSEDSIEALPESPKTGDRTIGYVLLVGMSAVIGMAFLMKKNKAIE